MYLTYVRMDILMRIAHRSNASVVMYCDYIYLLHGITVRLQNSTFTLTH